VLPVTVRDKKGALVTSLKISDFTLTETAGAEDQELHRETTCLPAGLLVDTAAASPRR